MSRWPIDRDRHYPPLPPDEIGSLIDGDLELVLLEAGDSRPADRWSASHTFVMVERDSAQIVGKIQLRLGDTEELILFGGHIGFGVDEAYRGRRFAARSVMLLLPLAYRAGMRELVDHMLANECCFAEIDRESRWRVRGGHRDR